MTKDEEKQYLQEAIDFIQTGEYQKAKSTIAYILFNLDKQAKTTPKVPCGKTLGHGEYCTNGYLCEQCSYILRTS